MTVMIGCDKCDRGHPCLLHNNFGAKQVPDIMQRARASLARIAAHELGQPQIYLVYDADQETGTEKEEGS